MSITRHVLSDATKETMLKVWLGSPYEGTKLLIHLALALEYQGENDPCIIPMTALCLTSHCDEPTVLAYLTEMQEDKNLFFSQISLGGTSSRIVYVLSIPDFDEDRFDTLTATVVRLKEENADLQKKLSAFEDSSKENQRLRSKVIELESQLSDTGMTPGYVYVIQCGNFFKIGQAKDVTRRLLQLAIALPQKAELLHTIPTTQLMRAERYFHDMFSEKRTNGEWFSLTDEDLICLRGFTEWPMPISLSSNGVNG